ncbi:hypothetical protein TD95_004929 [Thielaviopsis punctulata]|uniref:cyclin-dependent kinase n=1 Tax=Thielaviopsis punctulata TaxID=72032 RepID=A0A0F4ZAP6_9PEZI|nr:hypothetical protein TD95_004929 [Thielaviopsis punctulata]
MNSRWAASDPQLEARAKARKQEKESRKRRLKREKEEEQTRQDAAHDLEQSQTTDTNKRSDPNDQDGLAIKRRRLSVHVQPDQLPLQPPPETDPQQQQQQQQQPLPQLRFYGGTFGPPGNGWGAYEKMNDIGQGAYGSVIRVRRLANDKVFAIKRLKPEVMGSSAQVMSLPTTGMREIEILRNCNHRNVVKMVDVVSGSGGPSIDSVSIVLEFIEHDLRTILATMPDKFQPSEVKTLMLQLFTGLDYLHSSWIIHRDLKPANILLTNRGVLKIADFGMARYIGNPPPRDLTRHIVTLWYRAPELLLGTKSYSSSIDMWSAGCIFYELVTKATLFPHSTEALVMQNMLSLCGPWSPHKWPDMRRLANYKLFNLGAVEHRDANPATAVTMHLTLEKRLPTHDLVPGLPELLCNLLTPCPHSRMSAKKALESDYFSQRPRPKQESLFPTFPSKAGLEKRIVYDEPPAPARQKLN